MTRTPNRSAFSEEQIMIRDAARVFARERLAPQAAARDREAGFPKAAVAEMGELIVAAGEPERDTSEPWVLIQALISSSITGNAEDETPIIRS